MQRTFRWLLGLMILATGGCQSYSPYGYGYGGGYPTMPQGQPYMPQGAVMAPGQPTLVPGSTFQGSPRAVAPNPGGQLTEAPPFQQPGQPPGQFQPPSQFQQPNQFQQQNPSGAAPKRVPDPLGDEDELPQKPVGMKTPGGVHLGSITADSDDPSAAPGEEAFTQPVQVHSASSTTTHADPAQQTANSRPSPYKFDSKEYSWLRGVVEQDERDKSWHIRYNPDPQNGDTYGGTLTLINDSKLDALLADDVVYLEGTVDAAQRDRFGKPMYRVQKALRLTPKGG